MADVLLCQCPGDFGIGPEEDACTSPVTQEDLLCDWCRYRGCHAELLTPITTTTEVPF